MKSNKGYILVTTLWIIAILSLFAMGIGFRSLLELRLGKYNVNKSRARYLAKAGVVKASGRLLKDGTGREYDTIYECGITLVPESEETPETIFGAESNKLGRGSFSVYYIRKEEPGENEAMQYGMMDEERKIDVKLSSFEKMADYKKILQRLSPSLTDDIIDAIRDWQDTDHSGEAEDWDYETEFGYPCKDAEFECIEELLLVKGMTPDIFDEIRDYVTVYTDGKINVNTASYEVLNAVINDEGGTYDALVDDIADWRKGDDKIEGTGDDRVFTSAEDLVSIAKEDDIHGKNRLSQVGPYFIVKSENFRIASRGKTGKITQTVTCVVKKGAAEGEEKLKYYHEE